MSEQSPPSSWIKRVPVSFTCSVCGVRGTHQLLYIPKDKWSQNCKKKTTTRTYCRKCNEYFELEYSIKKTKWGEFKLEVFNFWCGLEKHKKKFKIIQPKTGWTSAKREAVSVRMKEYWKKWRERKDSQ